MALTQLNLVVRDMAAAVEFYRRLGWSIETPTPEHARAILPNGIRVEFDTPEFAATWDSGYPGGTGGSTLLGVETATRSEVDELYRELIGNGGRARQPPYDAFWGSRFAIVEDPDGNPIGLLSPAEESHRFWPPSQPPTADLHRRSLQRMRTNRSAPLGPVIPELAYPDVGAAVEWLVETLGFVEHVRIGPGHRAQLSFGEGSLIVADIGHGRSAPTGEESSQSVMLRVDDVAALCDRVRKHGGEIVREPRDFAYGERQCTIRDPGGHRWTLTQTLHDVAPEEWGGITVHAR